jgi:hypothetical protein
MIDPRDIEKELAARREAERDWQKPIPSRREMTDRERIADLERRMDQVSLYLLSK